MTVMPKIIGQRVYTLTQLELNAFHTFCSGKFIPSSVSIIKISFLCLRNFTDILFFVHRFCNHQTIFLTFHERF